MLDGVTLDQMRTFIAAVDEGSFSAAGRKLRRAQSLVSQTLANLEGQLGVSLFNRTGRRPVLTEEGKVLLADARAVVGYVDLLKARAKGLAGGLEPELAVVVDVLFPMDTLTATISAFHEAFPATPLRLFVEAMGAVIEPVLQGRCAIGVMGSLPVPPPEFSQERLLSVPMVRVAAPSHPLASLGQPIPTTELSKHIQLVLSDRTQLSRGRDFGVISPNNWRLADLGAKHALLRAGLGWGGMPLERVQSDLSRGTLIEIEAQDTPRDGFALLMSAVYRTDTPPGPAGRWFVDHLKLQSEASVWRHSARRTTRRIKPRRGK